MTFRMKPYKFRHEGKGNNKKIYAIFRDHDYRLREVEVSEEVYAELSHGNLYAENIARSDERHKEYLNLSEEEQTKRGAPSSPSAEDEAMINHLLDFALQALTATQARRSLLAYKYGYSYAEIAELEGCSPDCIRESLVLSKKKLKEIFGHRPPDTPSECRKE